MEAVDEGGFALGEDRHLVADGSEEIVRVRPPGKGEVFARALLKLCVEDVRVPLKDVDKVVFDLREEVHPLKRSA